MKSKCWNYGFLLEMEEDICSKKQIIRDVMNIWLETVNHLAGMRNAAWEFSPAISSWRVFYIIAQTFNFILSEMEACMNVEAGGGGISIGLGAWVAMKSRSPL